MSRIDLQVGKTYKTDKGKEVEILEYNASNYPTPFRGRYVGSNVHSWWQPDGSHRVDGFASKLDLVKEVPSDGFINVEREVAEIALPDYDFVSAYGETGYPSNSEYHPMQRLRMAVAAKMKDGWIPVGAPFHEQAGAFATWSQAMMKNPVTREAANEQR